MKSLYSQRKHKANLQSFSVFVAVITLLSVGLFGFAVKGDKGNPLYFQKELDRRTDGPFELTNSTSRFALTRAIVENGSFFFDDALASFASPDLTKYNGGFFSLFTPGVSFVAVPFYAMGKMFGFPQLFTYLSTIVFALGNFWLIVYLSKKLGGSIRSGVVAGFLFLFATNSFAYALSLTQHHMSTFLILLAIHLALKRPTLINDVLLGLTFGSALLADIPNATMMLPIGLYALSKHGQIERNKQGIHFSLQLSAIGVVIGMLPMIMLFGWYNKQVTGSWMKTAQTIGRTSFPEKPVEKPKTATPKDASRGDVYKATYVYVPRAQPNGLYILLLSDERGWMYYNPIILVGFVGLWLVFRKEKSNPTLHLVIAVSCMTILSYSMFGDPWGGWAFGPRYLIPATALVCAGIGVTVDHFRKWRWLAIPFLVLTLASVRVNTLGALTTAGVPPKVEALALPDPVPYTIEFNEQFLQKIGVSSLVYRLWFDQRISPTSYARTLYVSITVFSASLLWWSLTKKLPQSSPKQL